MRLPRHHDLPKVNFRQPLLRFPIYFFSEASLGSLECLLFHLTALGTSSQSESPLSWPSISLRHQAACGDQLFEGADRPAEAARLPSLGGPWLSAVASNTSRTGLFGKRADPFAEMKRVPSAV